MTTHPVKDIALKVSVCAWYLIRSPLGTHIPDRVSFGSELGDMPCIDGWLMRQRWCPNCKRDLRGAVPVNS